MEGRPLKAAFKLEQALFGFGVLPAEAPLAVFPSERSDHRFGGVVKAAVRCWAPDSGFGWTTPSYVGAIPDLPEPDRAPLALALAAAGVDAEPAEWKTLSELRGARRKARGRNPTMKA